MQRILKLVALASIIASPQLASAASKMEVCHKGSTLSIASPAVKAHLGHGDSLGVCPPPVAEKPPVSVILMRCDAVNGNIILVAASASEPVDGETPVTLPAEPGTEANCATAVAFLLNGGWSLPYVTSGTAVNQGEGESGFVTEYTFVGTPRVEPGNQ